LPHGNQLLGVIAQEELEQRALDVASDFPKHGFIGRLVHGNLLIKSGKKAERR